MRDLKALRNKARNSRTGPVIFILTLTLAAIIALLLLDPYHRRSSQPPDDQTPIVKLIPNPPRSTHNPAPTPPSSPDHAQPEPVPPAPSTDVVEVEPDSGSAPAIVVRYVASADYPIYHRLSCKYARRIDPNKLVAFPTASAARAAGYVPCKVCRPPEDDSQEIATNPPPVEPAPTPTPINPPKPAPLPEPPVPTPPQPKPVRPTPKPPVTGFKPAIYQVAPITFPYEVADRELSQDEGPIRVDYTVEVEQPLTRGQALNLARKLVVEETTKNPVNAVSFVIRRKVTGPKGPKWVIWIDWAPGGSITKAGDVQPGDYRIHKFYIVLEGIQ